MICIVLIVTTLKKIPLAKIFEEGDIIEVLAKWLCNVLNM